MIRTLLFRTLLFRLFALLAVLSSTVAAAQTESRLFEVDWTDLSAFRADLQDEYVERALALEDAPVYHLQWIFDGPTRLQASQEVRVSNYSDVEWEELHFHLHPNLLGGDMQISSVAIDEQRVRPHLQADGALLTLRLPEPLTAGQALTIALDYELEIPTVADRNYGIFAYRQGTLSMPHAYATLAVHEGGEWDLDLPDRQGDMVNAVASFFRVRLDAPAGLDLVTTGTLASWRGEDGRQVLEVTAGPVRDFYLAASSGLDPLVERTGGVTIRGHADEGAEDGMRDAVGFAAAAIEFLSERYGGYPYRELDLVPISTSALGVEFPGAIALRRQLFTGGERERLLESTTVHEVVHQWYYGLVGSDQVSEPWLDESLTQYLTLRYFLWRYGEEAYGDYRADLLGRWAQVDRRVQPVGLPVAEYSSTEYNALVYGLGPLVVEWLATYLERPNFDAFLRDYTERFGFGYATTEEFRRVAEEGCDCSLESFFTKWITGEGETRTR